MRVSYQHGQAVTERAHHGCRLSSDALKSVQEVGRLVRSRYGVHHDQNGRLCAAATSLQARFSVRCLCPGHSKLVGQLVDCVLVRSERCPMMPCSDESDEAARCSDRKE